MTWPPEGCAGKTVELPPDDVAERMAGQGVSRQQDYVEQQDQRADSDADSSVKKQSVKGIVPKKNEEDEANIEKVAMEVLQNKRERGLAAIAVLPALADGASRRIHEKSPVISLAVVVAGDPESQRPNQDQQRRRKRPPAMMWVNERRIKRREIRAPFVVCAFKGAQRGI